MDKSWSSWVLGFSTLVLLYLLSQPCAAQTNGSISPSEEIITWIQMIEPGQPIKLTRSFHVHWGEKDPPVHVTPTSKNWKAPNGNRIYQQPEVVAEVVKGSSRVWKVDVTLRDVTELGLYRGKIVVTPKLKGGLLKSKIFIIRLIASFKPTISVIPKDELSLKVSNCWDSRGLCPSTYLFVPEVRNKTYRVGVKNTSPAPVSLKVEYWSTGVVPTKPVLLLKDEGKPNVLQPVIEMTNILPGDTRFIIAVADKVEALSAGSYHGSLQISARPSIPQIDDPPFVLAKSGDESYFIKNLTTTDISTSVNVRVGVLLPLLIVGLGICAGRVAATLSTSGFQAKLDFYPRFIDLQAKIVQLPGTYKRVLNDLLDEAWQLVLKGESATTIEPLFANMERHSAYVKQLLELREMLLGVPNGEKKSQAIAFTDEALGYLRSSNPDLEKTKSVRDIAIALLEEIKNDSTQDVAIESAGLHLLESAVNAGRHWQLAEQVTSPNFWMRSVRKIQWVFEFLSGTSTQGVGLYYTILRPLLHLTLLAMLVLYGVWQQYASGPDSFSFGSQGISQYAMLFLWGVSSDIINKTLQTISFGPKG